MDLRMKNLADQKNNLLIVMIEKKVRHRQEEKHYCWKAVEMMMKLVKRRTEFYHSMPMIKQELVW
jgi:hypothetical protein